MKRFTKRFRSAYLVYVLLGTLVLLLLSFVWVPKDSVIAGHDSGLPLNSLDFLKSRFYAWDNRTSFGVDNSPLFGSLTLHSVDYLSSLVAGTAYAGNWFNVFFWLSAIFIAASILGRELSSYLGKRFAFLFPPLVVFNFYLFQSIFILERAKYSLLVAQLLFLTIYFKFLKEKLSLIRAAVLSALAFFVFNGGALLGIPLYGSAIIVVAAILLFHLIGGLATHRFRVVWKILSLFGLTFLFLVFLNAYQILPYVPGIIDKSFILHLSSKVLVISKDWVNYISHGTSLLSLFRLQGVPSWYTYNSGVLPDPDHPYAKFYFTNVFLITLSFILPIIAFLGMALTKKREGKKIIYFFAILCFLSMFFSSGTHPPLGSFYGFLYDYLPGFNIFRTPYYKFASAYSISIAVLFSWGSILASDLITRRVKIKNVIVSSGILSLFLLMWLGYHWVIFIPRNIFDWKIGSGTLLKVPSYVFDAGRWMDSLPRNSRDRVLFVPGVDEVSFADSYKWGYWSLSPIYYSLTLGPGISNELSLTDTERGWVDKLYSELYGGNEENVVTLVRRLNINYLLIRSDSTTEDKASVAKDNIAKFEGFQRVQTFGEWEVYKISEESQSASAFNQISTVPQKESYLMSNFLSEGPFTSQEDSTKITRFVTSSLDDLNCESCLLEQPLNQSGVGTSVRILPNSPLYVFKEKKESLLLKDAKDTSVKRDFYLGFIYRRATEVKTMLDIGTPDPYITEDLKKINQYLSDLGNVLKETTNEDTKYFQAHQLLLTLTPIKNTLQAYVARGDFAFKDDNLKKEMLGVLWSINQLSGYYNIDSTEKLREEKVYTISSDSGSSYILYLNTQTLPSNKTGERQLPKKIELINSTQNQSLSLQNISKDEKWVSINLPENVTKNARVALKFPPTPDLFELLTKKEEYFPTGSQRCVEGRISHFETSKSYEVIVTTHNIRQELNLFFNETGNVDEFFKNEPYYISQIKSNVPFRQGYKPSSFAKDTTVYLCNKNGDYPDYDSLEIHEIFAPQLVLRGTKQQNLGILPQVSIQQASPIKYILSIKNAKDPYILSLNNRYSPLWKLTFANSKVPNPFFSYSKFISPQVVVDGYANGWVIDKSGDYQVIIEYFPQELFYVGIFVSAASVLLVLFLLNKHK